MERAAEGEGMVLLATIDGWGVEEKNNANVKFLTSIYIITFFE